MQSEKITDKLSSNKKKNYRKTKNYEIKNKYGLKT